MLDNDTTICYGNPTLRERQRIAQEAAILAAAHALIVEKGFEATTMDDIAAHANISKPTLYARFPSKEAIAVRAVVVLQKEGLAFMHGLPAEMPPAERLRAILNRIFWRKYVVRSIAFGAQKAALTPQIRANPEYQKHNSEIITALMQIVVEGQEQGVFDAGHAPRIVAQTMLSFVRDAEIDEIIQSGQVSAEAVVQTLTDIVLFGIEKR